MKRVLFPILLAALLSSALLPAHAALTNAGIKPLHPRAVFVAASAVSLQQAAAIAKQKFGGKVVKAETKSRGKRQVHQIRLVNDGRVKTVVIDADTGQELN